MTNPLPQGKAPRLIPFKEHGISTSRISRPALKTIEGLKQAGFDAYIVGGSIRDLVLEESPKDFDVATNATPEQVEKLFNRCRRIGRRFQLVHVYFNREIIEVSTFRAAVDYTSSHPDRTTSNGILIRDNVYGSAQEDAIRRDFTINALFYDVESQAIIDYAGGYADLQQRILRTIGPAHERFREDPVRILRAVRFMSKLNASLCPDAERMIYEHGTGLQEIPSARLLDECIKLFHGGNARTCWQLLRKYNLLRVLFPATETALSRITANESFILASLENTDKRIRQNKPLNPAFFLAVFLWGPLSVRLENKRDKKNRFHILHTAAWQVIQEQSTRVAIPRRLAGTILEIWSLQDRFVGQSAKRCQSLLQHPKFRAAYDFMCLRAGIGELDVEICRWWTNIQELPKDQQTYEIQKRYPQKRRKKRH